MQKTDLILETNGQDDESVVAHHTAALKSAAADVRTAVRELRALFLSLVDEGFSEAEALQLLGYMMASQGGNSSGGGA